MSKLKHVCAISFIMFLFCCIHSFVVFFFLFFPHFFFPSSFFSLLHPLLLILCVALIVCTICEFSPTCTEKKIVHKHNAFSEKFHANFSFSFSVSHSHCDEMMSNWKNIYINANDISWTLGWRNINSRIKKGGSTTTNIHKC